MQQKMQQLRQKGFIPGFSVLCSPHSPSPSSPSPSSSKKKKLHKTSKQTKPNKVRPEELWNMHHVATQRIMYPLVTKFDEINKSLYF